MNEVRPDHQRRRENDARRDSRDPEAEPIQEPSENEERERTRESGARVERRHR